MLCIESRMSLDGVTPNARAIELAPRIAQLLDGGSRLISERDEFDPAHLNIDWTITCSDNHTMCIAPLLKAALQIKAPDVNLRFAPLAKRTAFNSLDVADTDLVIGAFKNIPARFYQQDLFEDEFVCIARKGHDRIGKRLSLKQFAELPHALMTLNADSTGAVDIALRKKGLQRRVAMTVSQFLVVPAVVAQSDCIACIPRSLINNFANSPDITVHKLPLALPTWQNTAVWTQVAHTSAAHQFMISELRKCIAGS